MFTCGHIVSKDSQTKNKLRGLFLEGLIFGGAYVRWEICVSKSIGLAFNGKEISYHFGFVLLCLRGQIPSTSPAEDLYSEGRIKRGFFALRFWGLIFGGAYTWRGLFSKFYGISVVLDIVGRHLAPLAK